MFSSALYLGYILLEKLSWKNAEGKKIPGYIEKITEQFTVKEKLRELEKCCLVSYPLVKW